MSSKPGGALPGSNHGWQVWLGRQAESSPMVQNEEQQPIEPAHSGTASAAAQKVEGLQPLRYSQGSPLAPSSPEASGAHWKSSLIG